MRRWGTTAAGCAGFGLALGAACSNGPTGLVGFAIGGEWIEVSTLVTDECDTGLPEIVTSDVTVIYGGGNAITFVYHLPSGDFSLSGSFDAETHAFTLPFGGTDPSGASAIGQQSGTFSSESDYTSTTTIVIVSGGETCTVETHEVGQRSL
jgi:hypothetical protein